MSTVKWLSYETKFWGGFYTAIVTEGEPFSNDLHLEVLRENLSVYHGYQI